MLIHHAAAHGVRLHEVKSTLTGDLDIQGPGISENARNGYKKIKVTFKVRSNAPREKIRELVCLHKKDHRCLI